MKALSSALKRLLPFLSLLATNASAEPKSEISAPELKKLLVPWQKQIDASRRDAVTFELVSSQDELTGSKVGGKPYIPEGKVVPTNSTGENMYLLAQINFAEVPQFEGFPNKGLIQFFISANDHYGANFDSPLTEERLSSQKDFKVIFHEILTEPATSQPYIDTVPSDNPLPFTPKKSLKMKFSKVTEIVGADDFEFESALGISFYDLVQKIAKDHSYDEEAIEEAMSDYFSSASGIGKLGGYASFTQDDPRRIGSKKRLLFQLDSSTDGELEIMWGDMGIGGFFIDGDRLKRLDFSEVMYNWDCG